MAAQQAATNAPRAPTRKATSPAGRGTRRASTTAAHVAQSSTAAVNRTGPLWSSRARANTAPAVSASDAHAARAVHVAQCRAVTATDLRGTPRLTKPRHVELRTGMVTSIGSLPHRDADAAASFVLRHHHDLPAAPQLPRRSPLEGMIAQAARGLTGVVVLPDGSIDLDPTDLDPSEAAVLDGHSYGGLLAFLSASAGRHTPVKLQLTGPVTLALALPDAGARGDVAVLAAGAAGRIPAPALPELVEGRLPDATCLP